MPVRATITAVLITIAILAIPTYLIIRSCYPECSNSVTRPILDPIMPDPAERSLDPYPQPTKGWPSPMDRPPSELLPESPTGAW